MHEKYFKKMTSHGSINVPINLRRSLGIQDRDPMVVEEKGGAIIITPHTPRCMYCGGEKVEYHFYGRHICRECGEKLRAVINENCKTGGNDDE